MTLHPPSPEDKIKTFIAMAFATTNGLMGSLAPARP
jgi:hypothetical protein